MSYTTINTAQSAISAITLSEDKNTTGCHPLVSRFMKGIYKGLPPTPRYQSTWDVQPVLTYLAATNPVHKLDLKMLTLKLVMLIALVSAQRGQSLHILDIGPGCMKEVPDGYKFLPTAHIKQSRPGYKAPTVVLRAYPANPSLCVCTCLKEYLKRTKPLRGTETKLFVSFTKPHKRVSRETLSRWICTVMTSAGVDTTIFKPHSTHAAATSKAKQPLFQFKKSLKLLGGHHQDALISFRTNLWNPPHLLLLFSRLFSPEIGLIGNCLRCTAKPAISYRKRLDFTFLFFRITLKGCKKKP